MKSYNISAELLDNGFDIVAVGIKYERGEVMIMIPGSWAGSSVIAATVRQSSAVKSGYGVDIGRFERDVSLCGWSLLFSDPKERFSVPAIAGCFVAISIETLDPERRKDRVVKRS